MPWALAPRGGGGGGEGGGVDVVTANMCIDDLTRGLCDDASFWDRII